MKILAADDQPIVLKSIVHVLCKVGFEVTSAINGQQAIDAFDKEHFDLVLVDLNMPVKSGYEVIDYIRKVNNNMVPIMVMSGMGEENTIVDAFRKGANDYISKPVGLNEVVIRVKKLLNIPLISTDFSMAEKKTLNKNGVGVVIPCYNEEDRLKTESFAHFLESNSGYQLCFVNDGSKDNTLRILDEFKGRYDDIIVHDCKKNSGKAEAVRQGMLHLLEDKSLDYIGFLDADLSTNFEDYEDLVKTLSGSDFKLVAGSRIQRIGASIYRVSSRGIISKTVNYIIRKILAMEFQDTQCGAKVMKRDLVEPMFTEPFLTRWIFDVEIFLRMKNKYGLEETKNMICEQPLKRWVHIDGSKLSMKDSVQILFQLYNIAKKY
ncbi:MAG: CheY-like chemotaxis protein [Algoriphagus sp.]|jgi:CheY-like chemotaxis protein